MKALAFDQLHRNEADPVDLVHLVDHADVGMLEGRRGSSFPKEAPLAVLVPDDAFREGLEGDFAVELDVEGPVDDTHATAIDFREHLVVGERPPDHGASVRAAHFITKAKDLPRDGS